MPAKYEKRYRPGEPARQPAEVKVVVPHTEKEVEDEINKSSYGVAITSFERRMVLEQTAEDLAEGDVNFIGFSLFSRDLQESESICQITREIKDKDKFIKGKVREDEGGLMKTLKDPRMGVSERGGRCATCHMGVELCPGHMGYIPFPYPIYHPELFKMITSVLSVTCFECSTVSILLDKINKPLIQKSSGYRRLMVLQDMEQLHRCNSCASDMYTVVSKNNQIVYKSKLDKKKDNFKPLDAELAYTVMKKISWSDSKLLGFKCPSSEPDPVIAKRSGRPENMIMWGVMVIPPMLRPPIVHDDRIKDNPFTVIYTHILQQCIKLSEHKKRVPGNILSDVGFVETMRNLFTRVSGLIDSSDPQSRQSSGRDASVKKVIQGKQGWFRGVMQGKGVDFSARSVASPNPNLKFNQVSIPRRWASILTKPERVYSLNREALQEDLLNGKVKSIVKFGTKYKVIINQNIIHGITEKDRNIRRLQVGDVVHRHLREGDRYLGGKREGDIVLVNRQPTLHKGGMMGHEVVFWDEETVGMALPAASPYNLDFDGDEVNIHVPQDIPSTAEATVLTDPRANLLNSENEKALISPVYDSILGVTMMTEPQTKPYHFLTVDDDGNVVQKHEVRPKETVPVDPEVFTDATMQLLHKSQLDTLDARLAANGVTPFSGRALFSALLPEDFFYQRGDVFIRNGVLVRGMVSGSHIGSGNHSIVFRMIHSHGASRTSDFINDVTFVTNRWLLSHSVSFNIDDLVLNLPNLEETKSELIDMHREQVFDIGRSANLYDAEHDEAQMIGFVENLKAKIFNFIVKNIPEDNVMSLYNRAEMGKIIQNMPQIIGIVGQQYVFGKRIHHAITGGLRCLPTFDPGDKGLEAGGCILSSFAKGLDMSEQFILQMSGREALINMGVNTQVTGDMHNNKLVSGFTGIVVAQDGTVRNTVGNKIIQYAYGDDGASAGHLKHIKYGREAGKKRNITSDGVSFTDILGSTNRLNTEHGFDIHDNFKFKPNIVAKRLLPKVLNNDTNQVDDYSNTDSVGVIERVAELPQVPQPSGIKAIDPQCSDKMDLPPNVLNFYNKHLDLNSMAFKDFYMDMLPSARKIVSVHKRIPMRKVSGLDAHVALMGLWQKSAFIVYNFHTIYKNMDKSEDVHLVFTDKWEALNDGVMMRIDAMKGDTGPGFDRFKFNAVTRDALLTLDERARTKSKCETKAESVYEKAIQSLYEKYSEVDFSGNLDVLARNVADKYNADIKKDVDELADLDRNVKIRMDKIWDSLQ